MMRIIDNQEVGDHVMSPEKIKATVTTAKISQDLGKPSSTAKAKEREQYTELATAITAKWNLTTPNAIDLLVQQFEKINDYNPEHDFFHFPGMDHSVQ